MPYTKSIGRRDFDSKLKSYKTALLPIDKIGKSNPQARTLSFQAIIFIISAQIEEYLKSLIETWVSKMKMNHAKYSDLHENTKTFILAENQILAYKKQIYQIDERSFIKKINITDPIYSLLNNAEEISASISASALISNRKYPKPENLLILFFRLGIDNIFTELNSRGSKDYRLTLRSFLDVREALAHQIPPALTLMDMRRHVTNIEDLINTIDRVFYSHVCKISGAIFWPS